MSILEKFLTFFHRIEELPDRMWNEIQYSINRDDKCKFCEQTLSFPITILPCGHLYDAKCFQINWNKSICPECQKTVNTIDVVQSDQQVAEVPWNPTVAPDQNDDLNKHSSDIHSLEALLSDQIIVKSPLKTKTPVLVKQTDDEKISSELLQASKINVKNSKPFASRQSPLIREPSPKVTSPRISRRNLVYDNAKQISTKDLLSSKINREIWQLVQNFWLIPDSQKLIDNGHYYDTTFQFISGYIPEKLYLEANKLKVKNLTQLIEKDSDMGSNLMYAMMLFLSLEYYTRDHSCIFDVKQKFRQLFNYQLFKEWENNLPKIHHHTLKNFWKQKK